MQSTEPNIAYRATPSAPSAIAVVVVRGPQAVGWVGSHWISNIPTSNAELKRNQIRYGTLHPHGFQASGEAVVLCRTELHAVEIHCHGGSAAAENILLALSNDGFQRVAAVGFAEARSPGAVHPFTAQAELDLIQCKSLATASILMDQYRGALQRQFEQIEKGIQGREYDEALTQIDALLSFAPIGLHLIHPWRVVLAGPPNAGKSSLLNAMLGYERAIVHDSAGTTRDLIPERTSFGGWPIDIVDSAGVRNASDEIERMGVDASLAAIAQADLVLVLVAPPYHKTSEYDRILNAIHPERVQLVFTKSDLVQDGAGDWKSSLPIGKDGMPFNPISTSTHHRWSIEQLMERIQKRLVPAVPPKGQAVPFRREHCDALIQYRQQILKEGIPS